MSLKPQVVSYASVRNPSKWQPWAALWVALWAMVTTLGLAAAFLCAMQVVHYRRGLPDATGGVCGTCYHAIVGRLGLSSEHATTLGLLAVGMAVLGGVKAIRSLHEMKWRGRRTTAVNAVLRASDLPED